MQNIPNSIIEWHVRVIKHTDTNIFKKMYVYVKIFILMIFIVMLNGPVMVFSRILLFVSLL